MGIDFILIFQLNDFRKEMRGTNRGDPYNSVYTVSENRKK